MHLQQLTVCRLSARRCCSCVMNVKAFFSTFSALCNLCFGVAKKHALTATWQMKEFILDACAHIQIYLQRKAELSVKVVIVRQLR